MPTSGSVCPKSSKAGQLLFFLFSRRVERTHSGSLWMASQWKSPHTQAPAPLLSLLSTLTSPEAVPRWRTICNVTEVTLDPHKIDREISDYIGRGAVLTPREDVIECSTSLARISNGDGAFGGFLRPAKTSLMRLGTLKNAHDLYVDVR